MGKKKGKKKAKTNGTSVATASRPHGSGGAGGPAANGTSADAGSGPERGAAAAPQEDQRSTLERRREKLQSRTRAVEAAEHEVSRLEQDLDHTARVAREQESSLTAATARVAALEQALLANHHERVGLQAALEGVRAEVERAKERAAAAERKYDKAVLEEVVRREKAMDLALHG